MRLPSLEGASGVTSEPVIFENVASRTVARPSETVRSKAVVMLKSSGLKQNLINAAGRLVAAALQKGNPPAVASPSNEPTAVAAVTWVAMPDIVAQWRPVLRPLGFKIALHSVFCHQSPQVSFLDRSGKTQRCELADLLIVVDETASGAIQDRRAVFVQAKMFSASGVISISTASRDQLELYELWPSFSFVSGPYKPVPRDFAGSGQPGSSNESGRYGGIDLPPTAPLWEHIVPSTTPAMRRGNGIELAEFVAGMVVGDAGIGREALASGQDEWSMTVDEILSITAAQSVTLVASLGPGGTHPRGVTSLASLGGSPPPDDDSTLLAGGPDRGISFVHVNCSAIASRE